MRLAWQSLTQPCKLGWRVPALLAFWDRVGGHMLWVTDLVGHWLLPPSSKPAALLAFGGFKLCPHPGLTVQHHSPSRGCPRVSLLTWLKVSLIFRSRSQEVLWSCFSLGGLPFHCWWGRSGESLVQKPRICCNSCPAQLSWALELELVKNNQKSIARDWPQLLGRLSQPQVHPHPLFPFSNKSSWGSLLVPCGQEEVLQGLYICPTYRLHHCYKKSIAEGRQCSVYFQPAEF